MLIFQVATLEGWTDLMTMYSDSFYAPITITFFVMCIVVCSIFLLNLTIAYLLQTYKDFDKTQGFLYQNDVTLRKIGAKHGLPEDVVEEILEMDAHDITCKDSRR